MKNNHLYDEFVGNESLKYYLSNAISEDNLPHALIFDGPEGSGKMTAAIMTACLIQPEFSDKIEKLDIPDVTLHGLEDGKKSIGISVIREIKSQAIVVPQILDFRLFIIDKAHLMTIEAQNALLKILEEPPKDVYFFLLSENSSLLLPTVKSRAPILRMQVFEDDELLDLMIKNNEKARNLNSSNPELFKVLVRTSEGTIGNLIEKLGNEKKDSQLKLREKTDELLTYLRMANKEKILLYFTTDFKKEEIDDILQNLSTAVRDMLTIKFDCEIKSLYFSDRQLLEESAADFAKSTLMKIYEISEDTRSKLALNVNVQLFMMRAADLFISAVV